MNAPPKPWVVILRRDDGREKPWNSYTSHEEAMMAAQHLCRIGCPARVVGPDDLALEAEQRR